MAVKKPSARAKRASQAGAGRDGRRPYRRIVAKFGTSLLTAGTDQLDLKVMSALVGQVPRLRMQGAGVIVVTSGAIAAGRHRLNQTEKRADGPVRKDITSRQVLASVGQSHLMQTYDRLFAKHSLVVGQTLLTRRDLTDRVAYLNARNTLMALLELGAVPIVNENDVVAVDEIESPLIGDNDNLSALVANLVDADLLAPLTDTGGLYTSDPRRDPSAQLVPRVERVTPEIERLARDGDPTAIDFPRTLLGKGSLDFSFSGIKTAVLYHVHGHGKTSGGLDRLSPQNLADIAASFQAAVVDMLVIKTMRAVDQTGVDGVVLGGGVAANSALRQSLTDACSERGLTFHAAEMEYCQDNAAMIAALGYHQHMRGEHATLELDAQPR